MLDSNLLINPSLSEKHLNARNVASTAMMFNMWKGDTVTNLLALIEFDIINKTSAL